MNNVTFTVTRVSADRFSAVSDLVLSDGSKRADMCMRLEGKLLRSHESRGDVRIDGLLRLTLGPISFAKVSGLAVGESINL